MKDFVPKQTFTLLNKKPNEDIYEISITLKDVQGAVAKTAKVFSEANVNLRNSILFDAIEKKGIGYWTSFVDLSKAIMPIDEIEEELHKLDVVQNVEIVKPNPLPYDIIHFPVMHGESAATIMPVELFGSLFDEIERILTPSGFEAVLYNAGKKSGAYITKLFAQRYMLEGETSIAALAQATKAIGWGQIENVKISSEGTGKVKIRMCFEALLRGFRKEKVCHWTRGFIAGFLGVVKGKALDAVELKCIANGDELCEFEVKPC